MTALRRSRWALSFADLCLLLLGFFVLLHASGKGRGEAVEALSGYFSGRAQRATQSFSASRLFEPGEAMLTEEGRTMLGLVAKQVTEKNELIEIVSVGEDPAGRRFDRWELAAARLAAAARALREAGVSEERIRVLGLRENDGPSKGQRILIRRMEAIGTAA